MTTIRTTQISIPSSALIVPNMLDSALLYRSWNLSVIPICVPVVNGRGCYQHGSNCPSPGKKPLVFSSEYHQRLPTEQEIRQWWAKWPLANIAIITGRVSKNLVVLDADDDSAIELINKMCSEMLSKISIVLSQRGGRHFYFSNSIIQTGVAIRGYHLDVRADGVYIIAPPSIGPNGVRYQWIKCPELGKFPSMPQQLIDFVVG
jgi:hypothetical protein